MHMTVQHTLRNIFRDIFKNIGIIRFQMQREILDAETDGYALFYLYSYF